MSPAVVQYSPLAERDLQKIAKWTKREFGEQQAVNYILSIDSRCSELAAQPKLARPFAHRHRNMRRMEHRSHVIFFLPDTRGIVVVRILHKSMLPGRHGL